MTIRTELIALKRTLLECGRVLLAQLGHDPYGMLLRDKPWKEIVLLTYRAHRNHLQERAF